MPALAATDLTVTIETRWIEGRKRHAIGSIAIAGVNTYSTGGIPLPAKDKFGMVRSLDSLDVTGGAGNTAEYQYVYDKTNNKLELYGDRAAAAAGLPLTESTGAEVPGARTVRFHAIGW